MAKKENTTPQKPEIKQDAAGKKAATKKASATKTAVDATQPQPEIVPQAVEPAAAAPIKKAVDKKEKSTIKKATPETDEAKAEPIKKATTKKAAAKKTETEPPTVEEKVGERIETVEPPVAKKSPAKAKKTAPKKAAIVTDSKVETPQVEATAPVEVTPAETAPVVEEKNEIVVAKLVEAAPIETAPVVEEKKEVVIAKPATKKAAAVKPTANTSLQKITFLVRFYTKPGQHLFITAKHPLFGNGNPEEALPMQFLNADAWTAQLPVTAEQLGSEKVVYNYLLKEPDGSFVYDGGDDKILDAAALKSAEVVIVDSWNFIGYFENVFYTEPFKNVLLKVNYTKVDFTEPATFTHTFKVKAPLVNKGEIACLVGSNDELANWSTSEPILLHKTEDEDSWSIKIDLSKASFPIQYKYGICNLESKATTAIENGENRYLDLQSTPESTVVLNDGFIRLPDNTWKGAGVAIPVFSLRTEKSFGSGEFTDIKALIDWSKQVGLKLVQLLPVNDTNASETWRDSYPYSAISAFALHAMYLNLDEVVAAENKHFLEELEGERNRLNSLPSLDYEAVNGYKWHVIHKIYPLQKQAIFASEDYQEFFKTNEHWLVPYAAFCILRDKYKTTDFTKWQEYKKYDANAVQSLVSGDAADIAGMYYFVQYHLHLQLKEAAAYAHSNGIIVKGDIAIGISKYSVDTWIQPELFNMNMQAGAPPDDFAVTGQNWGFPTYNWQRMKQDGFAWWKQRFEQMSYYFDAFRIDHILGFFRIWSVPSESIQGIMGHFVPAIPVHISEFHQRGIWFDYDRYVKPFINQQVLNDLFGDQQWNVRDTFLTENSNGTYDLRMEVATQQRIETFFAIREQNGHNQWLKQTLFNLVSNVILFEEKDSNGQQFHFRFGIENTTSFKALDPHTQWQLKQLSVNYFYERQNDFWYNEAMQKLPALKKETNMLICGEDLGMVPDSVPEVMRRLGLLSLEVQRMPKDKNARFANVYTAPYLSVVTPSTHDMSTIRGWWEEDHTTTQKFYNEVMGQQGEVPFSCDPWINKAIVTQHLQSPAMWSIFQLQDLMGSNGELRRANPYDEQINKPAITQFYWQYRMHLTFEELAQKQDFNSELQQSIKGAGR